MLTYIFHRLLLMIPTLIGVTAVTFFIMALAPGQFGGSVLNQEGAQTEGEQARLIRERFQRRYGLDQPHIVQYGRWLNQISPVGFRMASDITFSKAQRETAQHTLEQSPAVPDQVSLNAATEVTLGAARYLNLSPEEAAQEVLPALTDLDAGRALLKRFDSNPPQWWWNQLDGRAKRSPEAARQMMVERLRFEGITRNRIRFDSPAFKVPSLGESLRGRDVSDLILEHLPITVLLNVITIPIIYIVALFTGIYAARHRGRLFDVSSGMIMLALWSVPVIWAGVMLIGYLANRQYVQLFPTAGLHSLRADSMAFLPQWTANGFECGWLLDTAWHLVLPVVCMTYGGFAVLSKLTRGSILENLGADFVRTARAKGVNERAILFRHVLRNSILPLITVAASILPALLTGAVVVENIFSLPGMGKLGVDAAFMKDRELVMGTTLIIGLIGLLSELVRDLCYAIADPRVSYEA